MADAIGKNGMKEFEIHNVFESQFVDKVLKKEEGWEKHPFGKHPSNNVVESILWWYSNKDSRRSASVDIALKKKNDYFFFEVKPRLELVFSACGYLLFGSQLHRDYLGGAVHSYMVSIYPKDGIFNIYFDKNKTEIEALSTFLKATRDLGLILLEISDDKKLTRVHLWEANKHNPLASIAKRSSVSRMIDIIDTTE